jgi:mRNA interferase RelE/StbE
MAWKIELLNEAERDIDKLDFQVGRRILKFLYQRVAVLDDPRSIGVALTGVEFGHYWKYRVGDYRIVCDIQDKKVIVLVLRVGHRREVYR